MNNVKIVTCYRNAWWAIFSKLIRFVQKTDFSHYAIIYKDTVYHATGDGTHKEGTHSFGEKYTVTNIFYVDAERDPTEWLVSKLGIKYGYMQILGILLITVDLLKINPWRKGIICNEFVLMFLEEFKRVYTGNRDNYDLRDTLRVLNQLKARKRG